MISSIMFQISEGKRCRASLATHLVVLALPQSGSAPAAARILHGDVSGETTEKVVLRFKRCVGE